MRSSCETCSCAQARFIAPILLHPSPPPHQPRAWKNDLLSLTSTEAFLLGSLLGLYALSERPGRGHLVPMSFAFWQACSACLDFSASSPFTPSTSPYGRVKRRRSALRSRPDFCYRPNACPGIAGTKCSCARPLLSCRFSPCIDAFDRLSLVTLPSWGHDSGNAASQVPSTPVGASARVFA